MLLLTTLMQVYLKDVWDLGFKMCTPGYGMISSVIGVKSVKGNKKSDSGVLSWVIVGISDLVMELTGKTVLYK